MRTRIKETVNASVAWREVAAQMAYADAEQQAEFMNIWAKELRTICQTHYKTELQWQFVKDHLSEEALEMVGTLACKGDD